MAAILFRRLWLKLLKTNLFCDVNGLGQGRLASSTRFPADFKNSHVRGPEAGLLFLQLALNDPLKTKPDPICVQLSAPVGVLGTSKRNWITPITKWNKNNLFQR